MPYKNSPRVLITCADQYMGQPLFEKFVEQGYEVASSSDILESEADVNKVLDYVLSRGPIDILLANLAEPPSMGPVQETEDADWRRLFTNMVDVLMYLVRAVTPHMLERGSGKIIAITSAAPLRGIPNASTYCAARGAQNSFIKAVGLELARSNIQVNAIAQNYIHNNTYFPDSRLEDPKFLDHLKRNVPTGKLGDGRETAELAAYLASSRCSHIVGQVIPLAGGWAT